jgi:hypothetical protein
MISFEKNLIVLKINKLGLFYKKESLHLHPLNSVRELNLLVIIINNYANNSTISKNWKSQNN